MDTRKITITETSHYMDLAGLFHDAGLENTDRVPDGFITAFQADTPDGKLAGGVSLSSIPSSLHIDSIYELMYSAPRSHNMLRGITHDGKSSSSHSIP